MQAKTYEFVDKYVPISFREELRQEIPSTTYVSHGIYMYPAKFIPQVVRFVFKHYANGKRNFWVFDPFAGSGTVAIEASLMGINYILWDLNPIMEILVKAATWKKDLSINDFYIDFNYKNKFLPDWKNITYWHPEEFLEILTSIWGYYHEVTPPELKPIVAIPLLKITRYFSYSDEKISKLYKSKYAKKKVLTLLNMNFREKIIEMYYEEARRTMKKVQEYISKNPKNVENLIYAGIDSFKFPLEREVDLLLTSPPYLQAQEYIRSSKLELFWLGYSEQYIKCLSKLEIPYRKPPNNQVFSSHYLEYKDKIKALNHKKLIQIYESYFKTLAGFFTRIHKKVKERIIIFVSPVKIRNIRIPIDVILKEHLEYLGWEHEKTFIDTIKARRLFKTKTNPATGLEDERTLTEHLLVMRRK